MKKIKICLLFILSVYFITPCFAATPNAGFYYAAGNKNYDAKNYKSAIVNFTKAIQLAPNNPNFYAMRAESEYSVGNNYSGAIRDYTKAILLTSNHKMLYILYTERGKAKLALKDTKGAIEDTNVAITINSSYAESYIIRGLAQGCIGCAKEAAGGSEAASAEDYRLAMGDLLRAKILRESQNDKSVDNRLEAGLLIYTEKVPKAQQIPTPIYDPAAEYAKNMAETNAQMDKILQDYQRNSQMMMNNFNNMMMTTPCYGY